MHNAVVDNSLLNLLRSYFILLTQSILIFISQETLKIISYFLQYYILMCFYKQLSCW